LYHVHVEHRIIAPDDETLAVRAKYDRRDAFRVL